MTIGWDLHLDGLALVFLGLVVVVGAAVGAHAWAYLAGSRSRRRVLALLGLFALSMALLVTADDLLLLYLAWEATSILSFLLIGTKDVAADAREAARRALFTTGGGGLALLIGIIVVIRATGERTMTGVIETGVDGPTAATAAALILAGALAKSAQVPFHRWLPGAMAAPAPVSAYLHSATMVKAGVFLVARLSPAFSDVPTWEVLVLISAIGAVLTGGVRAIVADDLKALYAWSTVSQLGFLVLLLSSPTPKVVLAGVGLLVAHALAKAALFLSVGTTEKLTGTRSLRALTGLGRRRKVLGIGITVAFASLAGVPPTYGFISKEAALVGLLDAQDPVRLVAVLTASVLTAVYATRVIVGLWARPPAGVPGGAAGASAPRSAMTRVLVGAPTALALLVAALGVVWPVGHAVAASGATTIAASAADSPLKLWAGLEPALGLSIVAIVLGVGIGMAVVRAGGTGIVDSNTGVLARLDDLDLAGRLLALPAVLGRMEVAALRPGILRPTVAVVLVGAAVVVVPVAVVAGDILGRIAEAPLAASVPSAVALGVALAAGIGTAMIRRRFAAVISLGVVGFALSAWFVTAGAPDLALTQALVETVVILAFLLVLRRVPVRRAGRIGSDSRATTRLRAVVAVGTGLGVGLLALLVSGSAGLSTTAEEILARTYSDGQGSNSVNVILTDIRSLDTLGEVAVVAVAAIGAARLFGMVRSDRSNPGKSITRPGDFR